MFSSNLIDFELTGEKTKRIQHKNNQALLNWNAITSESSSKQRSNVVRLQSYAAWTFDCHDPKDRY
jgi:hypothetical protein